MSKATSTLIRQLTENDTAAFRDLRLEGLASAPEAFAESDEDFRGKSTEQVADMLDSHGCGDFVLGAFVGGELVGVTGFYTHTFAKMAHKGTIWGMYVKPSYRTQGIGQSLLRAAIVRAAKLPKLRQLSLTVFVDNEAAKKLYVGEGFVVTGREPAALKVNERYCDELFMQRSLGIDT